MDDTQERSRMALEAAKRYARLNNIDVEVAWRYIAGHFGKPPMPRDMPTGRLPRSDDTLEKRTELTLAAAKRYARMNDIPLRSAWYYIHGHFGKPPMPEGIPTGRLPRSDE
ncbi:MAG: hypothetical protein MPJ06_03545 [Nitrosopumilus sp.]|nr:hypothetical protein [Nitrosopumilus sp.]MDA7943065.1 hypothetical protein [Nitrosopumilus sp.]